MSKSLKRSYTGAILLYAIGIGYRKASELKELTGISKGNIYYILNVFEAKEYISKTKDTEDTNRHPPYNYRITPIGEAELHLTRSELPLLTQFLRTIPKKE